MPYISRSQNFEDYRLHRAFNGVKNGRYIDIGAWDPEFHSVSHNFYAAGWRGINVEPMFESYTRLQKIRPEDFNLCRFVTDKNSKTTLFVIANSGLSSSSRSNLEKISIHGQSEITEEYVDPISLSQILEFFKGEEIHWLKIDVEGAESEVIDSWGDHSSRPLILVIEATEPSSTIRSDHKWNEKLLERGYVLAHFDGLNNFYCLKENQELKASLSKPISIFDDVLKYEDYNYRKVFDNLTEHLGLDVSDGLTQFLGQSKSEIFVESYSRLEILIRELELRNEKLGKENLELHSRINEISAMRDEQANHFINLNTENNKLILELAHLQKSKVMRYSKTARQFWYFVLRINAQAFIKLLLREIAARVLKRKKLKTLVINLLPVRTLYRLRNVIKSPGDQITRVAPENLDKPSDPKLEILIALFQKVRK